MIIPSERRITIAAANRYIWWENQRFIMRRIYVVEEIVKVLVDNSMINRGR